MLVRSATPFTANADELSTSAHEKQAREEEKQAQQRQKRDEAEQQCCQAQEQQVQRRNDQAAQQEQLEQGEEAHMSAALARIVGLDPETLFELMPFHLVMNQQFQLLQAGSGISRVVPELATQGVQVDEQLTVGANGHRAPHMPLPANATDTTVAMAVAVAIASAPARTNLTTYHPAPLP